MQRPGQIPDHRILQKIEQRLSRLGLGSQVKIAARVRNGNVTLTGSLQLESQRRPVLRAASGVEGARQIVDQLQLAPPTRKWQ